MVLVGVDDILGSHAGSTAHGRGRGAINLVGEILIHLFCYLKIGLLIWASR